jgi:hypothetical protein
MDLFKSYDDKISNIILIAYDLRNYQIFIDKFNKILNIIIFFKILVEKERFEIKINIR